MKQKGNDITRFEGILDEIIERVLSIDEDEVGVFYGDWEHRKDALDRVRTLALRAESKFRQRAESTPPHIASAIALEPATLLHLGGDRPYFLSRFSTFIQKYPVEQQRAIKLWLKGRSYGEIADTLDSEGFKCTHATVGNWVTTIVVAFKQSIGSEGLQQPSLQRIKVVSIGPKKSFVVPIGRKQIFSEQCKPPRQNVFETLKFSLGVLLTFWAPALLYCYVIGQGLPFYLTFFEHVLGALLGILMFKKSPDSFSSSLPKNLVPNAPPVQLRKVG